jgi:hypothetical protein
MSASSSPSANANNTNNAWYRFFSILSYSSILLFIVSLLRKKKKLGLVEAHLSPDRGEFAELHIAFSGETAAPNSLLTFPFLLLQMWERFKDRPPYP